MTAIVISLVWRQIPSLTEVLRVLEGEGLLWVAPLHVSKQALAQRLARLPAALFAQLFAEVVAQWAGEQPLPEAGQAVSARVLAGPPFTATWLADGSSLEALRKKLDELKDEPGRVLGGRMMMAIEARTRRPVRAFYTSNAAADDKTFCDRLAEALPLGGLLIFDLGFFSFQFFDTLTERKRFFITRLRHRTAYKVIEVLGCAARYRDEIIEMGQYRSHPCHHRVRMVSVLWEGVWHQYLTNVLDPEVLTPREVCQWYRRRWRIEEAFLLTKRLLGLSYLWVGATNGVEIQIYATWIFYAVLMDLCAQVSEALVMPLPRISVEMVFRSLYHFSRAVERGEDPALIPFLVRHTKLFGLVKAERHRHRERRSEGVEVWGPVPLS